MRKTILLQLSIVALSATAQTRYTQYVDQRIGTGDHGHVFVGANVPQGMVNVGPTQIETGWDWCSGYHESGDSIVGFSHLHLSGTGCGDLGDIALMPSTTVLEQSRVGMASPYRHETEEMQPGYYAVTLDRDGTRAEMCGNGIRCVAKYVYDNKLTTKEEMTEVIENNCSPFDVDVDKWYAPLLYFPLDSTIVTTLLKAYQDETGDMEHLPISSGGGTYAKEADNCVAFGMEFPGWESNMHSPGEQVKVEHLEKGMSVFARAIVELGKKLQ